jgi:hypothetical protein
VAHIYRRKEKRVLTQRHKGTEEEREEKEEKGGRLGRQRFVGAFRHTRSLCLSKRRA